MAHQIMQLSEAARAEIIAALSADGSLAARVMAHGEIDMTGIAVRLDENEGEQMGWVPGDLPVERCRISRPLRVWNDITQCWEAPEPRLDEG